MLPMRLNPAYRDAARRARMAYHMAARAAGNQYKNQFASSPDLYAQARDEVKAWEDAQRAERFDAGNSKARTQWYVDALRQLNPESPAIAPVEQIMQQYRPPPAVNQQAPEEPLVQQPTAAQPATPAPAPNQQALPPLQSPPAAVPQLPQQASPVTQQAVQQMPGSDFDFKGWMGQFQKPAQQGPQFGTEFQKFGPGGAAVQPQMAGAQQQMAQALRNG